jgi:sodium-dependent dicarboxylate transporter 2/3/5
MDVSRWIKVLIPFSAFLFILWMPTDSFMMPGLTLVEQRIIAIFILAALCWILEPIPIYTTSVLVIVLELFLVSDKGLALFTRAQPPELTGKLLSHQELMATFASPIIMLFLGGFFLAMAATKYRLDVNLARVMLKPFGTRPAAVMLGLMIITAVFSMFMSNTATTAMMLSILAPVLKSLPVGDRARIGFVLSIPVAANIGGIGTPIGTPPNAIALKYINEINPITFGEWMMFGVPFVAVLLIFSWWLLSRFYPSSISAISLEIKGRFLKSWQAIVVYITFATTVLLWLIGGEFGLNSYVVAMIPVALFSCTKIINKDDLQTISWDVLWLVSGGIALGVGLENSGLAARVINAIPFASLSAIAVLIGAMALTLLMANFMSHTATANLLLPLMAVLATSLPGLETIGSAVTLLLAVTFAASLGMSLPISTPPNALASATGQVDTPQMAKVGVIVGVVGLLLTLVMLWLIHQLGA